MIFIAAESMRDAAAGERTKSSPAFAKVKAGRTHREAGKGSERDEMFLHFAIGAVSLIWIVVIFFDVFEVMLLPRRVRRRLRLVRIFFRSTWAVWSNVALRIPSGDKRETLLRFYGPFSMLLLIICWISNLICGFGCLSVVR